MDMTSGKIHKEDGNGGWLPYGFGLLGEESCTKTLQKFYVNCIFLPLQTAAHPAILNSVILREKGGSSMMNWNWRDLDDVDESHAGGVDFSFFGPALDSFRGCGSLR